MPKPELKIDEICEMITEGLSFRDIAKALNVKLSTLHDYTAKNPERSAKTQKALEISANDFIDKAEEALNAITDDANPAVVARQKALAAFYTYKAARRNPAVYSEKAKPAEPDSGKTKKYVFKDLNIIEPDAAGESEANLRIA